LEKEKDLFPTSSSIKTFLLPSLIKEGSIHDQSPPLVVKIQSHDIPHPMKSYIYQDFPSFKLQIENSMKGMKSPLHYLSELMSQSSMDGMFFQIKVGKDL
jgi:hypothetical protein